MFGKLTVLAAALAVVACSDAMPGGANGARDQIKIVGSSTVYPFTAAVAEVFGQKNPGFKTPVVESTGTGSGMKLFCAGIGASHPDIENASRRMKKSEFEDCKKNGVNDIVEIQIGIDGLALIESNAGPKMELTPVDVYKAIAANPFGKPNTAKTWKDVNPALPAIAIKVFGPPSTSGTRDSLAELILDRGCNTNPDMESLKASDENKHRDICTKVREDGVYVESGENDNLIVQKLTANPDAIGVLGYSFLEENLKDVRGISLNGIAPTYESIADFTYPGARAMFIYVKGAHLRAIPGLKEFLAEFASGWNPDGYLAKRGLIAAPADVRAKNAEIVQKLTYMTGKDLT